MFKSFKKLSALLLGGALLAVGCATEGDIHKLNERIDALITGKVANIENQITLLQQADVTLENALKGEIATAKADLTKEIDALKAADVQFRTDMNNNVTNLTNLIRDNKADIEGKLNQAKTDFTNAIGAANEKIRIRLKSFDHRMIDKAAADIVRMRRRLLPRPLTRCWMRRRLTRPTSTLRRLPSRA